MENLFFLKYMNWFSSIECLLIRGKWMEKALVYANVDGKVVDYIVKGEEMNIKRSKNETIFLLALLSVKRDAVRNECLDCIGERAAIERNWLVRSACAAQVFHKCGNFQT
uniref:Uncharacterized protein n=1 Tax=Micrurus spixii TaxID=129469 RepID=A0A2D4MZZ6_9SAUR